MKKTTNRPKQPEKLGTNLDDNMQSYKTFRSTSRKGHMGISSSERNLVFSRQVLNLERGCYR